MEKSWRPSRMIAENLAMYASDADASEGKPIGKYKGDRESVD